MRSRLHNASRVLARIPSIGYAIGYFMCIPAFAVFYTLMPHAFYHSTVQFEPALIDEARSLLQPMQDEIVSHAPRQTAPSSKSQANPNTLRLQRLVYQDGQLELYGSVMNGDEKSVLESIRFKVAPDSSIGFQDEKTEEWTHLHYVTLGPKVYMDVGVLFPDANGLSTTSPHHWLHCSTLLHQRLVNYSDAQRGFPSEVSFSFWRMLYFSVVTITTVGYGDIVPITSLARFCIGLEAILGVLLVGLFLNALSYEAANRAKTA